MHAMVLPGPRTPLRFEQRTDPEPGDGEIRVRVSACGVCRTDLHVVDAELPDIIYPIIPGHEIVGRVDLIGGNVTSHRIGDRVGIPWFGHTCGICQFCRDGMENLCDNPLFTGYTRDGGFATHSIADARYAFPLGEDGDDISIAPLLCAGLIGWRSLVMAGQAERLVARTFGLCLYAERRQRRAGICPPARRGLGRRVRPIAGHATGRGHHLCARGRAGAGRAACGAQGWQGRLRGYSHERHSELPLRHSLGRAAIGLGREPYPSGWVGFSQGRAAGGNQDPDDGFPARRGQ